ncbi:MAG: YceI family protein [Terriglobales bacterium]
MNTVHRKSPFFLAVLAVLVLAATSRAQSSVWQIDPAHSSANFVVRHLKVSKVRGLFSNLQGTVTLDEKDITRSSVEATIDTSTIDTHEAKRDAHLKSADFLDVANHPTMRFVSKKIEQGSDGELRVIGDLTLRGVTRQVVLALEGPTDPVKGPGGALRRGVTATTKINRMHYGVAWNRLIEGIAVVDDEVGITLELELVQKTEPSAQEANAR